jgi:hypothetical protein
MHRTQALRVFVRLRVFTCALAAATFAAGFTAGPAGRPGAVNPVTGVSSTAPRRAEAERKNLDANALFSTDVWQSAAAGIDPEVLRLAFAASQCAVSSGVVRDPATLTIIDYSKPSVEPRLWVLDLKSRRMLYEELVSHGQGSGGNLATRFSNEPESHQTSLGLFVTDSTYVGRNGYSLRLDGLDKGFNDRARERAIVMHGAPYVNSGITRSLGRLGRSHGCPAVRDAIARELIDRVKGGGLVFSYYPDPEWLAQSRYLGTCGN